MLDELIARVEEHGVRLVRGWDGATPCKPDKDIVLAASYFTVAAALRARQESGR